MNSIPKIYDYILCNRLSKWFIPDSEQAGAQPKRGCVVHKISLRLLIEYAIMKRKKLFIVFVDFSAAYDRVPRNALVVILVGLGCGIIRHYRCQYCHSSVFARGLQHHVSFSHL